MLSKFWKKKSASEYMKELEEKYELRKAKIKLLTESEEPLNIKYVEPAWFLGFGTALNAAFGTWAIAVGSEASNIIAAAVGWGFATYFYTEAYKLGLRTYSQIKYDLAKKKELREKVEIEKEKSKVFALDDAG